MSGTLLHIAIADKIYDISGSSIVKNLPLFFGGNIAPDAVHAKEDYQRRDKKHYSDIELMSSRKTITKQRVRIKTCTWAISSIYLWMSLICIPHLNVLLLNLVKAR